MAIRRPAEQKEPVRAAAAVTDAQRKSHKHASQVRMPVRVPCYKLPRNDIYPHYEPVKLAAPVEVGCLEQFPHVCSHADLRKSRCGEGDLQQIACSAFSGNVLTEHLSNTATPTTANASAGASALLSAA